MYRIYPSTLTKAGRHFKSDGFLTPRKDRYVDVSQDRFDLNLHTYSFNANNSINMSSRARIEPAFVVPLADKGRIAPRSLGELISY